MHSHTQGPTRRQTIITIAAACGCAGLPAEAMTPTVDQITDLSSTAATDMFRFAPDLLRVEPGTALEFTNSRGDHTVHSVPQLWPEGVVPVKISHKPSALVTLPVDGLYGFRCRRHGKYGMVMLVIAGAGEDLSTIEARVNAMRAGAREKARFRELIARYRAES
ncbi:MAG: plastocyanin/azurin family copper-binding protein [Pseudomonadota bacterium]